MLKLNPFILSLLSAMLLFAGWPPLPTAVLLFIGLVPLFIIHHQLRDSKRRHLKFWGFSALSMFLFNLGTTWWVWNASPSGCIMMLSANTLIMSTPLLLYSLSEKVFPRIAFFSFVVYWLGMEYFHFNWNAAWPWLTLGKGLASVPFYIQWYEYTGEMGGSLLILSVNIWVFRILRSQTMLQLWKPLVFILSFAAISFACSLQNFEITKGRGNIECVVAQPNVDPYEEKFPGGNNFIYPDVQVEFAVDPSRPHIGPNTALLLLPETAIVGFNNESDLNRLNVLESLRRLTDSSKLCVIAGAETFSVYNSKLRPSLTARYDSFSSVWFDNFNSAISVKRGRVQEIYHKSKLVAGVEKMPFAFLEKLSINLGGTSGSLGTSNKAVNFTLNDGTKVAPLICYESIFGDYASEFVRDGAELLAVVTNDGWWGNSPGYMQHLQYGAIRCIETRREMVRSANTGVSAKINQFGRIVFQTKYKEKTAFKCYVNPHKHLTFYVRHGNLIGTSASVLAVILCLSSLVRLFIGQKD